MIVNGWLPSVARSSTPVTVIVRGKFQLPGVNVTCAGNTKPSVRSLDANVNRTEAVGRRFKTSVNVSESPNSLTTRPCVGPIVTPAAALSTLMHETSCGSKPSYTVSADVIGCSWIAYAMLPSISGSLTPATVTVRGIHQLPAVNTSDAGNTVPSVVS